VLEAVLDVELEVVVVSEQRQVVLKGVYDVTRHSRLEENPFDSVSY
jgi:hypothetical protein